MAVVDAADYEALAPHDWFAVQRKSGFYAARKGMPGEPEATVFMHRWLLGVHDPAVKVDHENGDTLDDRRQNLRRATSQQNSRNIRKARGASPYKGVSRNKDRWQAYIGLDGKPTYLGTFATELEAAEAYDRAALEHFGEFAATNAALGLLAGVAA